MRVRANSKHLKDIKANAKNITFNKKPRTQKDLEQAMIYINCGGFDSLHYEGNGKYIYMLHYGCYSFDSIVIPEWEGK